RSRKKPNCDIEIAANTAMVCQLGNIAYRSGRKLDWDAAKGKFTDKTANDYLAAQYHNGWKLPKG
ncbi:MAG: gfo/Idh/MocA family oxidoreductase, partial [Sphingobacteriaceae bacterium]|nr:gfo/Idh/MocA family oxidoreductase [Cytophagaceae bacterium]